MISLIFGQAWNCRSEWTKSGSPSSSSHCFVTAVFMRVPLPAASIIAQTCVFFGMMRCMGRMNAPVSRNFSFFTIFNTLIFWFDRWTMPLKFALRVTSSILIITYFYIKINRSVNFYKNLIFVNNISVNNARIYDTINIWSKILYFLYF